MSVKSNPIRTDYSEIADEPVDDTARCSPITECDKPDYLDNSMDNKSQITESNSVDFNSVSFMSERVGGIKNSKHFSRSLRNLFNLSTTNTKRKTDKSNELSSIDTSLTNKSGIRVMMQHNYK